jgi:hypothetical protein
MIHDLPDYEFKDTDVDEKPLSGRQKLAILAALTFISWVFIIAVVRGFGIVWGWW